MIFRIVCLIVTFAAAAHSQTEAVRQDLFVAGTGGYHTYRIPALVLTTKGTVLAFCEGRKTSSEDTGDIDLLLKRSRDEGKTWSEPTLVHEAGGNAAITIGNPCPIVDRQTGRIHLLFVRDYHQLFSTYSDDDGLTWSAPQEHTALLKQFNYPIVLVATGPGHGIQMRNGRLVAPVWLCNRERKDRYADTTADRIRAGVIYSDDNGQTWRAGGLVPADVAMLHECTAVEREDGSLLLNMRAYEAGYRAVSTSPDGGLNWTTPHLDKTLPDPTCEGSIIQLTDSELVFSNLAVSVDAGGSRSKRRRNLTLRLSTDGGVTWPHARVLEAGLAGYSDLGVTTAGNILCLFENGTDTYHQKISFVILDRQWLLSGAANK